MYNRQQVIRKAHLACSSGELNTFSSLSNMHGSILIETSPNKLCVPSFIEIGHGIASSVEQCTGL